MFKINLIFIFCFLFLSNSLLFSFDSEKTYYTIQIKSVPIAGKESGLQIYNSLKAKGYLVYYYKKEVNKIIYMRIRVGIFNTISDAKNFAENFKQKEGFDYYVDKTSCHVENFKDKFQIITTPSGVWYRDSQISKEIFRFDKKDINDEYLTNETKALVSPDGNEIVFWYESELIKVNLSKEDDSSIADIDSKTQNKQESWRIENETANPEESKNGNFFFKFLVFWISGWLFTSFIAYASGKYAAEKLNKPSLDLSWDNYGNWFLKNLFKWPWLLILTLFAWGGILALKLKKY